jgi:two-component system OmpR family response regulator
MAAPARNTREITVAKILVVDDEEALNDLVSTGMRLAGHEVLVSDTGYGAVQQAAVGAPDLVVLDVNLPDIDGFEVCRRLRANSPRLPIIFLTARMDPADLREGFGGGGDDYLVKPFRLEELTLRVEALLRRSLAPADEPASLACGPIHLDPDAHMVTIDGQLVDLSPTEFRLLEYLLLNHRRVVSKGQILDYVWYSGFDGDPSIVDRYISYLRRKLGDAGELIATIRGVGYALRASEGPPP